MTAERILILFNAPGTLAAQAGGVGAEADAGVLDQVAAVEAALVELGLPWRRQSVRTLQDVNAVLRSAPEACVFNLVESLAGPLADVAFVPTLCHAHAKAVTGNDAVSQIIGLDKALAKAVLTPAGIATPAGSVVRPGETVKALPPLPVIVKPLRTDASEGIEADAVVTAAEGIAIVQARIARIHATFAQPALVEAYIEGREVNVALLEQDGAPCVLPLAEIEFVGYGPDRPRIVDYAAKWRQDTYAYRNTPRRIPADLPEAAAGRLRAAARAAWAAVGAAGYARVDFRLDANLNPFVLEINPNPDISPDSGFAAAVEAAGLRFADFVRLRASVILPPALSSLTPDVPPRAASTRAPSDIRRTQVGDRNAVLDILAATNCFYAHELAIAAEVLDEALRDGATGHYQSYVATADAKVLGWICFGPTPCTAGTWDIYWMAVDPAAQGQGIGRRLMAFCEHCLRERDARLAVVETAGRAQYAGTRAFYAACGFTVVSTIPDFYAPGDARVTLTKYLSAASASLDAAADIVLVEATVERGAVPHTTQLPSPPAQDRWDR